MYLELLSAYDAKTGQKTFSVYYVELFCTLTAVICLFNFPLHTSVKLDNGYPIH